MVHRNVDLKSNVVTIYVIKNCNVDIDVNSNVMKMNVDSAWKKYSGNVYVANILSKPNVISNMLNV